MAKMSGLNSPCIILLFTCSLLSLVAGQLGQLKPCYSWDGASSDNFPCDPQANVSACCGAGSRCVTNLYCISPSSRRVVGECTDRSWNDPACPYRLNVWRPNPNDRVFSYEQNTTFCGDGTVCPITYPSTAANNTCCNAKQGKTEINYHNEDNIIPMAVPELPAYYAKAGYTIPGYGTTTSSASPNPTAIGQTSSVPAPTTTPAAVPTPTPQPASSGLSTGAKAGIGVGVAVGAAVLAAMLAMLFFLRRRNRNDKGDRALETQSQPSRYWNGLGPGGDPPKRELSGQSVKAEMAAHDPSYRRGELPTSTARSEMDGS